MYIPKPSPFDPVDGHFGIFGGRYVPETLMPALLELEKTYNEIRFDETFWSEVDGYLRDYVGRPSPL
ncbi:MAG: tryptophan synthase subunit beta, partial [Sulfuricurvum sp.]|nr:tryptophan synthase subunit beta [Sulfuricurvum sp.]